MSKLMILMTFILIIGLSSQISNLHDVFRNGVYKLSWSIDEYAQTIQISLDAKTTGWVGIGFSNNGSMSNTDIIMCYYSQNRHKPICQDSWASSGSAPASDVSLNGKDDITDVSGSLKNGRTVITFKRKLKTGDKYDIDITKGKPVNVIFSYREEGNPDTENGKFRMQTNFTSEQILLYPGTTAPVRHTLALTDQNTTFSDGYFMNITFNNYTIPSDKTTYVCKYFDLNKMVTQQTNNPSNTTYHAIHFEPVISNEDIVHHMGLYGCDPSVNLTDSFVLCPSMHPNCTSLTWGWAVGIGNSTLPEEAGYIWGTVDTSKLLLQIHYNNENLVQGKNDSSGVNVHYTTKLRRYDAGMMDLGKIVSWEIPPGEKEYNVTGICDQTCTSKLKGDINILSYFFHGHKILRKIMTTFHKPDGFIDFTFEQPNYSFDHQRIYYLDKPLTVQRNFKAITICSYNSENRVNVTRGGNESDDEMCNSIIQYYPRENGISTCMNDWPAGCLNLNKAIRISP